MKGRIPAVVLICFLAIAFQTNVILASTTQDRALDFIENVLPIDSTQWNIELKVEGNASDISRLDKYNISVRDDDKVLIYFLGSMVGTADGIDVNFVIRENQFIYGIIDIDNAPSYSTFGRPLEVANVTNFLAKYQSWSGLDSTEMIGMLSNGNLSQNTSISSGGLTMTITCIDSTTKLSWTTPDSHKFEISFKNYFPTSFYDNRQIDSNIPTPTPSQNPLTAPAMTIITPLPVRYQNSSIPLFFGANILTGNPEITSISYSLDGNQNITITTLGKTGIQHFDSQTGYTYHINSTLTLDNLTNGNHTLWVYSHDTIGNEMSGSVQFSVDVLSETPTEPVPNSSLFILALIIIASILAVSISVLLYRRHQNR